MRVTKQKNGTVNENNKNSDREKKWSGKKAGYVCFLGISGTALLLVLGLKMAEGITERDAQVQMLQAEVAGLSEEKEELQEEIGTLATEKEALKATADAVAEELQTVEQTLKDTQETLDVTRGELETVRGELEEQQKEPTYSFDIKEVSAGTVVALEELDLAHPEQYFQSYEIKEGDGVYQRIYGKSYVENPHIGLDELRYFKVLHYNFDGAVQVGELIANAALEADYQEIFLQLFQNKYEIYSMRLIDEFWTGDVATLDEASMRANNTSGFCYRIVTDGKSLSNHAYGRAIDINPLQNPYVGTSKGNSYWYPETAGAYVERTGGEHMISTGDLCYFVFRNHGFTWGGDWKNPKDYQHFEKK